METKQFIRDKHSQAIINNDNQAYQRFRQLREKELNLQKTLHDVDLLKKEVRELREMIQQLIDGRVNG
jgi:hypothetical protein